MECVIKLISWIWYRFSVCYAADQRRLEMKEKWLREGGYACAYHDENIALLREEWGIDIPETGCEACRYYANDCPYTRMRHWKEMNRV